ncbi:hypothetical protein O3M35_002867 [Rhynocoris fuscipes]|uniref:Uncharacterized protein n=1 Tax=Rhynocoris fuscipes TaxID=488301 RepID=A0AAW1CTR2_9HEMI
MGQKGSKRDEAYFTEYEYLRLADLFRIDKNNLSTANADTFRAVWSQFMETSLMETWIQYFIRNEFHYHFHVTFDLGRLSLLYKGQTSPFMDVKSQAIMRVILGTSATDRVLAVNHSRVIEYFRDVITSYMRCVEVIRHTNYVKWRAIGCTAEDIPRIQMISYFLSNLSVTDGQVTELDLEMWLRDRVFVDDVLGTLLDFSFSFNQLDDNYHTVIPFPLTNQATIIDIAHVLFLNAHLTTMLKRNWAVC